jgi:hypothetical protein
LILLRALGGLLFFLPLLLLSSLLFLLLQTFLRRLRTQWLTSPYTGF